MFRKWLSKLIAGAVRPELEKLAKFTRTELMNFRLIADALQIVKSAALHTKIQQVTTQAQAVIVGLDEHKYSAELGTIKDQVSHLKDIAAQVQEALKEVSEAVEAAKAVTEKQTGKPAPVAPQTPPPTPAPAPATPVQSAPTVVPTADTVASGTATEEPITSQGDSKIVK